MQVSEKLTSIIRSICVQYSYVANTKKYRSPEGKMFPLGEAVDDILNRVARDHSQEYVGYSSEGELVKETIKSTLMDTTTKKKKSQTTRVASNSKASTYSTGLDTKLVENPLWKPETPFNVIDGAWCANLFIDNNSILYKKKPSGGFEIIGNTSNRIDNSLLTALGNVQNIPDVFTFVKGQLDILSTFAAKAQEYEQEGPSKLLSLNIPTGVDDNGNIVPTSMRDYLGIADGNEPKTNENIVSLLVYKFLNTRLPATVFFGLQKLMKYYNIIRGEDNKDIPVFQGFVSRSPDGTAPTRQKYFRNVLENYPEYLGKLKERPKPVSLDGSEPSFGVFNRELWEEDEKKYGGLTYEESNLVKVVFDPLDKDQRKFMFAWIYGVFFCLGVVISVLHRDNGGTLKSTLKQLVRKMVNEYYGADINFVLKRDMLCDAQYLFDSHRLFSIADAIFVDYDEPTTKGELWEKVKAYTGGVIVDFPVKELFHNPYLVSGSPIFWFGSNKPIYLQDKGAYERRLASIVTPAKNTWKQIPLNVMNKINTDIETQKREFHLLMKLGKKAYEEVVSEYGTLAEASVRMPSIAVELDSQSPWEEYLSGFYESLFEGEFANNEYRMITNDMLDRMFLDYKDKNFTQLKFETNNWRNYCKYANPSNETSLKMYDKSTKKTTRGGKYYKNEPEELTDDVIVINGLDETELPKNDHPESMGVF